MLALALVAAALTVGHADRNPAAAHGGIVFWRHESAADTFVDWHGHVQPYYGSEYWSPSGRHVARPYTECANGSCESWYVVTRADGSHRHVLPDAWSAPSWSKDDSTLAYLRAGDALEIAAGDGSHAHAVRVDAIACSFDCVMRFDEPKVSPDGRSIALLITTLEAHPIQPPKNVPADLFVVPATGGAPVAVGTGICPADSDVEWSPDGKWLAYISNPCDEIYGNQLEVTSIDGSQHGLSAPTDGYAWSPRRDLLSYGVHGELVVATPRRALRTLEHVRSSAWSPDGRRLVLERQGRIEILDNGTTHTIARGATPTWTSHGIAWSVPRCGPTQGIWLAGRRLTNRCTVDGARGTRWPDEVWAIDRKPEHVSCGAGTDIAHVDPHDVVAPDCERVLVRR